MDRERKSAGKKVQDCEDEITDLTGRFSLSFCVVNLSDIFRYGAATSAFDVLIASFFLKSKCTPESGKQGGQFVTLPSFPRSKILRIIPRFFLRRKVGNVLH